MVAVGSVIVGTGGHHLRTAHRHGSRRDRGPALCHRPGDGRLRLVGGLHLPLRQPVGHLHPRGHVDGGGRHRVRGGSALRPPQATAVGPAPPRGHVLPSGGRPRPRPRGPCAGVEPVDRFRPVPPAALRAHEAGADGLRGRPDHPPPRRGRHRSPHHRPAPFGHGQCRAAHCHAAGPRDGDGPRVRRFGPAVRPTDRGRGTR